MTAIRPCGAGDLPALYAIAVLTGDAGGDARKLYPDHRLIGDVYTAPYAVLAPELVVVAEDEAGVAGYAVGTLDTRAWEARLEAEWWPAMRQRYAAPDRAGAANWTAEERRRGQIHHPTPIPEAVVAAYPGHMHLNVLPRLQGRGVGRLLCQAWLAAARRHGAGALHVGAGRANPRAVAFWTAMGFSPLDLPEAVAGPTTMWLGRPNAD